MEYKGTVYAKIGGKYIACTKTIEDLESRIKELEIQLELQNRVKNNLVLANVSESVDLTCDKCGSRGFVDTIDLAWHTMNCGNEFKQNVR